MPLLYVTSWKGWGWALVPSGWKARVDVKMQHSLGGPRPQTNVWLQSVLLQIWCFPFNRCHLIDVILSKGLKPLSRDFSDVTEEMVTPGDGWKKQMLAAETRVPQQGWAAARLVPAVCSLHTPQHWWNTSLCCPEPVPAHLALPAGAKDPFPHPPVTTKPQPSRM